MHKFQGASDNMDHGPEQVEFMKTVHVCMPSVGTE